MPWIPTVRVIVNGESVDAATDNGPITDLTQRTDWLKAQLESIEAGTQLLLRDQTIDSGLVDGTPVYLDAATNVFKAAQAEIDPITIGAAGTKSFWQGIVYNAAGTSADIVIGGSMSLTAVAWAPVFEDGVFATGTLYLSALTGKLTTEPDTTGIVVGFMRSTGEFLVRLASPGGFLDHVHIEAILYGKPAGTVIDPAFGGTHTVNTPDIAQRGWLPASPVYFPGYVAGVQIPTGAVFGYNIQQVDEEDLRRIFPVIPSTNAQFSQAGSLLYDDLIVVNNYGIWWMDDSYGRAPWPVDYAASSLYQNIHLWTSRIIASSELISVITDSLIQQFQAGLVDEFAVATIKSTNTDDLVVAGTEGNTVDGFRGDVTLTNRGVTALRTGRGLVASAPLGNNTTGWKGITDIQFDATLPATHMWTQMTAVGDKVVLLTTNGANSGASISARGHRLGSNAADFIDFIISVGGDLEDSTDYLVTTTFNFCVDTAAGVVVNREVDVEFYRLYVGGPVSTTAYLRTEQFTAQEGRPGAYQQDSLGPYANVVLRDNDQLLVRIKNSTGGNPLTVDTLRVMSVVYGLTKV